MNASVAYKHCRYIFLLVGILVLNISDIVGQDLLASGPMVGYSAKREVMIWVQTTASAEVQIKYSLSTNAEKKLSTEIYKTEKSQSFTAHLIADQVEPGLTYDYELWIDGQLVPRPYPLQFQTQALWEWRTDPPDFSFVAASCLYINEKKYDRPGKPYGANYKILENIYQQKPDFMIWLGDNIYLREVDFDSRTGIHKRYSHVRLLPELQPLMGSVHHYAIWDDHDYGPNDSNRSYWGKDLTTEAFKLFWANPNYDVTKKGGITGMFTWNDCDFYLMDNRYHRTMSGVDGAIIGEEQLTWLIESLRSSKAFYKFICIGGQTLSDARIFENHAKYRSERRKIIDLLDQYDIRGVVFLGGDRHSSEITRLETDKGNVFYDVTSSALTAKTYDHHDEPNSYRVPGSMITVNNYAWLTVKGPRQDRSLHIIYRDTDGKDLYEYPIKFPDRSKKTGKRH